MSNRKVLSLKHFLVRSQALSLYRDIFRTMAQIDDPDYRTEMKQWARTEFHRNKKLDDLPTIRTQIALGRKHLNELKISIQMAK